MRRGSFFTLSAYCLGLVLFSITLYFIVLSIAVSVFKDLVIFFFSCVYSALFSAGLFLYTYYKKKWEFLLSLSFTLNVSLFILIFAIFGPVFIDRSISYHVAFIAAEKKYISVDQLEKQWSAPVFQKRIDDGITAGMIKKNQDGTYSSTAKARFFSKIMLLMGKTSNSLKGYEELKRLYEKGAYVD